MHFVIKLYIYIYISMWPIFHSLIFSFGELLQCTYLATGEKQYYQEYVRNTVWILLVKNIFASSGGRRGLFFNYFFFINHHSGFITQLKCRSNTENCLSLIKIWEVKKKTAKKIFFWPIRPIFDVVSKRITFITVTKIQHQKTALKYPQYPRYNVKHITTSPPL